MEDDELIALVNQVLAENPEVVKEYKKAIGSIAKGSNYLFGQVMKESNTRADMTITKRILKEKLQSQPDTPPADVESCDR